MQYKKILIIFFLTLFTISAFAVLRNPYFQFSNKLKIEKYPNGVINWTSGYFLASAKKSNLAKKLRSISGRNKVEQELLESAKKNLIDIILNTKVDSYRFVKNYFEESNKFRELFIEEIERNIIHYPPVYLGSGTIELVVKYPIFGKGSISDIIFQLDDNVSPMPNYSQIDDAPRESVEYSSIIIDLRSKFKFYDEIRERLDHFPEGIRFPLSLRKRINYNEQKKVLTFKGAMSIDEKNRLLALSTDIFYKEAIHAIYSRSQGSEKDYLLSPSIFPSFYDSRGKLIYSKDMVEISNRTKNRYVRYTKDPLLFYKIEIVGQNPLLIIADKIKGENFNDIVINPEDAKKIFLDSKTLENLKKGKIFLLVE